MASDAQTTASVFDVTISSVDHSHRALEERRWKGYWTRYWCFKSQKRERKIVPAARVDGASESARGWRPTQTGLALAPPSSPASFVNSAAQSPASFSLSLSAASGRMCSPGPGNTMFTIGPYAHETQLVSPPVFSTFTTEPSTAPFTPPPELAHLTTPSSPDVPFAQYIASSLEAKAARRDIISPLSTSTLASPCDTPASYTPTTSHLYLDNAVKDTSSLLSTSNLASPCDTPTPTSDHLFRGSPVGRLISPTIGYPSQDTRVFSAESCTYLGPVVPSLPTFNPFTSPTFNHTPFALPPRDSTSELRDLSFSVLPQHDSNPKHEDLANFSEAGEVYSENELESRHMKQEVAERKPAIQIAQQ